jgi:hypothetical protein
MSVVVSRPVAEPARPGRIRTARMMTPLAVSLPCRGVTGTIPLHTLEVRFRVEDRIGTQRLPLPDDASVSCP